MKSAVVLLSGGMDSSTLAYWLKATAKPEELICLSIFYGQRHKKELDFAKQIADQLSARHSIVSIRGLEGLLVGSALTDPNVAVPYGHYAAENMKITVVPNRNATMLAIAFAVAMANGASIVAMAAHAGDHTIYPDCRPEFLQQFQLMENLSNGGQFGDVELATPFAHSTKADIARYGDQLGVPWEYTWSCYEGGDVHCGQCGTCVERKEAFKLAGVFDPTLYKA
jgi:7-cyano-7-deazaguanine synthase